MKEMVIISDNSEYIKIIQKYLNKSKNSGVIMSTSIIDKVSKIGIAYSDELDINEHLIRPLKKCFTAYKKIYFRNMNLLSNEQVVERFAELNTDREYELCFGQMKFTDRIYLDSVFRFLTKELEYSWDRIGDILRDNGDIFPTENEGNLLKFPPEKIDTTTNNSTDTINKKRKKHIESKEPQQ